MSWYPALGKGPRVWPAVCQGSKSSQLRLLKHTHQLPCNAMQDAYMSRGPKVREPRQKPVAWASVLISQQIVVRSPDPSSATPAEARRDRQGPTSLTSNMLVVVWTLLLQLSHLTMAIPSGRGVAQV